MSPANRNFRSTGYIRSSPYNLHHRRPRLKPEAPPPLALRCTEGVGALPATPEAHLIIKQEDPCRPEDVGIPPTTPEVHFTIKQEDPQSPVLSQHPKQEELVPSLEEALWSLPVPQLQTPLADPVTGRITLDAVSLEMRPFAIKYNRILDIIDEVGAIAGCALRNLPETTQ